MWRRSKGSPASTFFGLFGMAVPNDVQLCCDTQGTPTGQAMRNLSVTYTLAGLLTTAVQAAAVVALVVPEIRARKATPDRIAACHDKAGTAQLDPRGVFTGCLVPPTETR